MIFGGHLEQDVSFQWDLELLNFELCGQIYGQFTENYAGYIEIGGLYGKTGIDWFIEKLLFLVCG